MLIYIKNNDKYGVKLDPILTNVPHIISVTLQISESLCTNFPECKDGTDRSFFSMMISTSIYII